MIHELKLRFCQRILLLLEFYTQLVSNASGLLSIVYTNKMNWNHNDRDYTKMKHCPLVSITQEIYDRWSFGGMQSPENNIRPRRETLQVQWHVVTIEQLSLSKDRLAQINNFFEDNHWFQVKRFCKWIYDRVKIPATYHSKFPVFEFWVFIKRFYRVVN